MATRTVQFEIKRQASPDAPAVWEKFELEWRPGMNVISAMMEIATNPVTADGRQTTPITYDSNCLEEICGSCAMRINGKARMACSALVDNLEQPIKIEPLSKFPLVRDLQVDRSVLFENLMRVKAWVPVDGTYDLGSGPARVSAAAGSELSALELHHLHLLHGSLPAVQRGDRLCGRGDHRAGQAVQQPSDGQGVQGRAPARAGRRRRHPGVRLCAELRRSLPQEIPLTDAISDVSRDVLVQKAKDFLRS